MECFDLDSSRSTGISSKCTDCFKIFAKEINVRGNKKYEARRELRKGLMSGNIKKVNCQVCGGVKTEAHHDDYNKPLEVTWLCRSCHTKLHLLPKTEDQVNRF